MDVDLYRMRKTAQEITAGLSPLPADCEAVVNELNQELLPGWPDDWLILEREHWEQARLHALESLAHQLQTAKQYLPALQAATTAIAINPIRETAHRIVIEVHVAEGNTACALKHYHNYQELLQQELEVSPSQQMNQLVQDLITTT
ncbi:bacterial transcriptional activator domain-containing protein [Streptomyces chattanoogensis]|uniref:bacterial transcriptional activator domain-containing protein n=1 Tax=Streptomyces chattanoogensis TaxID=66876 RepID=UPI000AA55BD0|nr:bacterial transcriptional activator domain-containing protein [Streptomyces chattanoogensis]